MKLTIKNPHEDFTFFDENYNRLIELGGLIGYKEFIADITKKGLLKQLYIMLNKYFYYFKKESVELFFWHYVFNETGNGFLQFTHFGKGEKEIIKRRKNIIKNMLLVFDEECAKLTPKFYFIKLKNGNYLFRNGRHETILIDFLENKVNGFMYLEDAVGNVIEL